ncbi:MAG: DUF5665 domain-containing protein [Firmicutes bacterium]|nr:DUF5665 domain-containing protein [Bacillota bacterium]
MTDTPLPRRRVKACSCRPEQTEERRFAGRRRATAAPGSRSADKTLAISGEDAEKINALANFLRRIRFEDYLSYAARPGRAILSNLLAGMAKGFGFAIGFSVLAFIAFYILRKLNVLQLPYIGDFIADLLQYIESVKQVNLY